MKRERQQRAAGEQRQSQAIAEDQHHDGGIHHAQRPHDVPQRHRVDGLQETGADAQRGDRGRQRNERQYRERDCECGAQVMREPQQRGARRQHDCQLQQRPLLVQRIEHLDRQHRWLARAVGDVLQQHVGVVEQPHQQQ
jgi:hypothetical protein